MFIKSLKIKNYKCFKNKTIDGFSIPNGKRGSGLNVLIGENGSGKTSLLEAINYLSMSNYLAEGKLAIEDFRNYKNKVEIVADTEDYECHSSIDYYKDWKFKCSGIEFNAKSRSIKERNKLLSSSIDVHTYFKISDRYYKGSKSEPREIDSRDKTYNSGHINEDGVSIFYFDKNRSRQINSGNYKTTFDRVMDDLNWRYRVNLSKADKTQLISDLDSGFFNTMKSLIGSSAGKKTSEDLKSFFEDDYYDNLKIDTISLLQPFKNAFFSLRKDGKIKQILTESLGSGIEMILTILLLKNISGQSKGNIIYLIDEPELHLHPKAQFKLLDFLLDESKDKQIFISTHSPYMFKESMGEGANLLLFKKQSNRLIKVINACQNGWGLFKRFSPTWGEINWFAYDLATVEFHNELYGYIEANFPEIKKGFVNTKKWLDDRKVNENTSEDEKEGLKEDVSLQEYVRHSIHHPENIMNDKYTNQELRISTSEMIIKINKHDASI